MCTGEVNAVVSENSCFRDVLEEMDAKQLGAVSVVNSSNKIIGLVTDGDVRRLLLTTQDSLPELFLRNVTKLMISAPKVISSDENLEECLALLEQYSFWVVPVADTDGTLVGMIHLHTLLKNMSL